MPRRCTTHPLLPALLRGADWVVDREAAVSWGFTAKAIRHRVDSGQWQELLPGVWLAHQGQPHRRQLLRAALLWAGPGSAIDAGDACRYHGIRALSVGDDDPVQVLTAWGETARSRRFVVVRRTVLPFRVVETDLLRWVEPAVAVVAATRPMRSPRTVLAVASDAVQRRVAGYDDLLRAHLQGPPRGAALLDSALAELSSGVQSVGEAELKKVVECSAVLPRPAYNAWLRLPGGELVCVDALWDEAALVHEVNGRRAHARADLFEDTMIRQSLLSAAGLTVLPNTLSQIRRRPRVVLTQLERCFLRNRGKGLPPGVEVANPPPNLAG